jgi:hypothetical protein
VIAIAQPVKGAKRGDFSVRLDTVHTTRRTIDVPEELDLPQNRPLGLAWSAAHKSPGKLAAATAQLLHQRGTVIVLVDKPRNSWSVAEALKVEKNRVSGTSDDVGHIRRFLADEMGAHFPLGDLLDYGVAVHHGGLSEDTRAIVEWLTEREHVRVLVATTTIAQGVNFPVSAVVFASNQYPYGQVMPPEDFWNIAGRAGRVDQGDLGVVALVATDAKKAAELRAFVAQATGALNSTLIDLVKKAADEGRLLQLETLAWQPGWSAFLQYLAHTYRQIGDHERFAAEVEQVLRGTLGFQALRRSHRGWADLLVQGVYNYAERIKGKPLKLVDATGFSWESVVGTLARLKDYKVVPGSWSPELFAKPRGDLQRMMGILLEVPELRQSLMEVTGGPEPDGDTLARILCDWVQGRTLTEMASEYFGKSKDESKSRDPVEAMTLCCRNIFGRLTQTASWGLAALQALTLGDEIEKLSETDQRLLRNLPARAYYGVNSDEAVALRLLGVPRTAAPRLAATMKVHPDEALYAVRTRLRDAGVATWRAALGERGDSYHRVWSIIEGEA